MPDASTILLVDDEDSIQTLLTFPLERDGYRVVQARDGEEALRQFAEDDVDLVVLDVMLPRLDGLEVCKRLRAESNVPIIMLTAREAEVLELLQDGRTNAEIATELSIGVETVRTHARNIYRKLGVPSRRELARMAQQEPVVVDDERRPVATG